MNLDDRETPNTSYDASRSWPYFHTLEFEEPAQGADDQTELTQEGPRPSWVRALASTALTLAVGIAIGVWVVPIVRPPPGAPRATEAGPPHPGPIAADSSRAQPSASPAS